VSDVPIRQSGESPAARTATVQMPPPPPTPPAQPGTATGPRPERPLTGLVLGPAGALTYAALVIAFNAGLGLVSRSVAVQQALRAFVVAVAGPQLQTRGLLAAVLSAAVVLLGYAIIIAPPLAIARARGLRFSEAFGLRGFRVEQAVMLAAALVIGGLVVTVSYGLLLRGFGISAPNNTVRLVQGFGTGPVAMAIGYLLVGVIAPFAEEVAFRGVVFAGVSAGWGTAAGVIISGLLFGIVHLEPLEMLPLALIGMGLAAVFVRARSLWPAVIAHGCYNVVVLTIAFASVGLVR
jgi:membrane protease YdiL (CAAX protease family)